jgi:hypothetical protein
VNQLLIKSAIRTRFWLTPRDRASDQIRRHLQNYLALGRSITPADGRRPVRVPAMLGVDEEMRDWSFFMILAHNTIVNRSITAIIRSLVNGKRPSGQGAIDFKKDVMPSAMVGAEQVRELRASVDAHLVTIAALSGLRLTATCRHPVFGALSAHGWHCMFGLHLEIHLRQAKSVCRLIDSSAHVG